MALASASDGSPAVLVVESITPVGANVPGAAAAPPSSSTAGGSRHGRTITYIAVGALLLTMIGVGVSTWYSMSNLPPDLSEAERRCEVHATVTTGVMSIVILAWPLLFHGFLGLDTLARYPIAILGFIWPVLLTVSDILSRKRSPALFDPSLAGTLKEDDVRGGPTDFSDSMLGTESLSITTLVFAVGTLFVHTLSKRQVAYTVPALKWALLLTVGFVGVNTYQDPGDFAGAIIQALKKSAFNMAVGLVITGIVLDVMFTGRRRDALSRDALDRESSIVE